MKKNIIIKAVKDEKGVSIVVFALALGAIVMIMALVMDIGMIGFEKARLSSAVDASALAGAQELISGVDQVESVSKKYAQDNIDALSSINVSVIGSDKIVQVTAEKYVDNYFSTVFGDSKTKISATANAKVENVTSMKGARPFAVIQQVFNYGDLYTLKEGAGDGISGNYCAIALGGNGVDIFRGNVLNGYSGTLSSGTFVQTETGNMSGTTSTCINQLINSCTDSPPCTYQSYNINCPRILSVPIVDSVDVNGKKCIQIVGFGTFFIEGTVDDGGHTDIVGRFITCLKDVTVAGTVNSSSLNDFGTYTVRLVK